MKGGAWCLALGAWLVITFCDDSTRGAAAPSAKHQAPGAKSASAASHTWPQWRGPNRDGKIRGIRWPAKWPERLSRRWKVTVGEGHSSPIVADGGVFVLTREGEEEVVRRLDPRTGKQVWRRASAVPYEMNPAARGHGKGPKSTPVSHNGLLYTLGISGILTCLEVREGRVRWRHDFSRRYRAREPLYGAAMSPIVVDDLLIAHMGGHDDGALTAFEASSGKERWRWTGDGPAYASPILWEAGGVRQIVTQTQRRCIGVDPASGRLLWSLPFRTLYDQNCVTPVAVGSTLIFGGTGQPTFAVRVRRQGAGWQAVKVWETRDVTLYMSTPVAQGTRLYALSERRQGQLVALDAVTGKSEWTGEGRFGEHATLLDGGTILLALSTGGELILFRSPGPGHAPIVRYPVAETPTWASPAPLDGGILVKDSTSLAFWEIPQ
jgi:outer membrane protein assembly factor BamB